MCLNRLVVVILLKISQQPIADSYLNQYLTMDFGRLPDVSNIDFRLPPDNPFTTQTLTQPQHKPLRVYVGLPIWAAREWLGEIYPASAKNADMLSHYARQYNTIELNVTHYQIPTQETIQKWRAASREGFTFCPKFPQIISHDKQLLHTEALTAEFCTRILELESYVGIPFLQLAPTFSPRMLSVLEQYIQNLPEGFPLAVEFRHPDWFSNQQTWQRTLQMLQKYQKTTVITDVAGRRDVLHQSLPTPQVAIRWIGNDHPSDELRIDQWANRIAEWISSGLEEIYIFVHTPDNISAPRKSLYWIRQLNKTCGLQIAEPRFLPKVVQGTLF
jgi:uncharacterized protein YecE (DUF72 family)